MPNGLIGRITAGALAQTGGWGDNTAPVLNVSFCLKFQLLSSFCMRKRFCHSPKYSLKTLNS